MRVKPKHIALFGNFGSDNLGNEASLKAMLDFIRRMRPDAQISCICYGIEGVTAEHGTTAVPMNLPFPKSWWFGLFNRMLVGLPFRLVDAIRAFYIARGIDVFIVPGTGLLDDFSDRWQAMPFDLFKWSLAARFHRRPLPL